MHKHHIKPQRTAARQRKKSQQDQPKRDSLEKLTRFEELVTHISSRLVQATCDQVDREIEQSLTQVRGFFRVDRCFLLQVRPYKECFRIIHAGIGENIPPIPLDIGFSSARFPWCYRKLVEEQEAVSVESLGDLPAEATIDKQSHREWDVQSFMAVPIVIDGTVLYIIALHAVHKKRMWPIEFTHRLGLLGEILGNTLERSKKSLQLEERLRFESLLAEVSVRFVNLPAEQVDGEIEDAQRRICDCLGLDLSALWEWASVERPDLMTLTHLYRPLGGPPVPEPMDAQTYFPWSLEQARSGKVIAIPSTENVPAEAARDQEFWRHFGIKTTLTIPLSTGGRPIIGVVSFNTMLSERDWPEAIVKQLQMVAQIFANALERKRADQKLRESETRLRLATNAAGAGLWILEIDTGNVWASAKTRELFHFAPDEELAYKSFLKVIFPEDRDQVNQAVQRAIQSGEDLGSEFRIVLPGGGIRWIAARGQRNLRSTGEPDRLMGVSFDLTARKQMEDQLESRIVEIEELRKKLEMENIYLRQEKSLHFEYENIIGKSKALKSVLSQVEQVASTDSTVLLTGETGTGKELIAQAIHDLSNRKDRVLVKVDCACLPAALVESELFGREKGAYTGAMTKQVGRFDIADGSTIFLDEIGELSLELQSKLLKVLQKGEFARLGSPKTIRVNLRVIAATNRNLEEALRKGSFREDLYYRLNVFPIAIPPLRERSDDIPLLVRSFVNEFSGKMGKKIKNVPRHVMEALQHYSWPGNVRELRNVIEQAVIISDGDTLRVNLPLERTGPISQTLTLEETERQHIMGVLALTGWRIKGKRGAAELLGLNPSTLYSTMSRLGISTRREKDDISP